VRDPGARNKVAHLLAMGAAGLGRLTLFKADLLQDGSFDAAAEGCSVILHTASPFVTAVRDPQRDLVDPAVMGTRNVLDAANRTPSVERVVLTSSCAALYGDAADTTRAPEGHLTEAVWNTTSSLTHNAYSFSKTLAEQAAWAMAKAQDRWRLVVVNPALIIGPALNPDPTSEVFDLVRQIVDGRMRMGAPDLELGVVDVRDVAEAHLRAAFLPQANGRNIVFERSASILDMADTLRASGDGKLRLPRRKLPSWLVNLVGPLATPQLSRAWFSQNHGHPWRASNAKAMGELGLTFRPVDAALREMVAQMMDRG
jgi:nucleoside-diphosphate-sugar epimerase